MELLTPATGLMVWTGISLLGLILTIIALIDIARNKFNGVDKLVWILVVIFLTYIRPILYEYWKKSARKNPGSVMLHEC